MQTVTAAEARESLPELLEQVKDGPVLIREGNQDVAVLIAAQSYEHVDRQQRLVEFKKLRDQASEELRLNLAKEGLTVEEFLADVLG